MMSVLWHACFFFEVTKKSRHHFSFLYVDAILEGYSACSSVKMEKVTVIVLNCILLW